MDQLIEHIADKQNPTVVGLDPTPALVPVAIVTALADEVIEEVLDRADVLPTLLASAYFEFNRAIIDAIADIVPAVKPQIAMYEALGTAGLDCYTMTCDYAQSRGLYVIGDIKRGDIGSTAAAYAHHLSGLPSLTTYLEQIEHDHHAEDLRSLMLEASHTDLWHEDAITINPYLGSDGIEPFVKEATAYDKSLFVLLRTSNPSSSQLQMLPLECGKLVYEKVAELLQTWGKTTIGDHGYSRVGAVVGATHPEEGARLRQMMPHTFFLVPGYGAQGGTAQDVAHMFDANGTGAIVNSSRGIIGAWKKSKDADRATSSMSLEDALNMVALNARSAALSMRDDLRISVYR